MLRRSLQLLGSQTRAFSMTCARSNVTTSSSTIEIKPAPKIPEPAKPVELFPSLESITINDLSLQRAQPPATPKKDQAGWYRVTRTKANQLPVYSEVRANGHRSTIIRRIEGSVTLLKSDLMKALELPKESIKIKPTSNQIKIKGDYVYKIRELFTEANF